jgi:chromosome segregation ATPase
MDINQTEIDYLRTSLKEANTFIESLKLDINNYKQEAKDLKQELWILRPSLAMADHTVETLRKEIETLKAEIELLRDCNYALQSLDYWQTKVEVKERDARIIQLQNQIEELQDAFHKEYLQDRGPGDPEGCGDNSCIIKKTTGMATNGGCQCGRGSFRRALQLVRKENETLKALINAMHEKDKLKDT